MNSTSSKNFALKTCVAKRTGRIRKENKNVRSVQGGRQENGQDSRSVFLVQQALRGIPEALRKSGADHEKTAVVFRTPLFHRFDSAPRISQAGKRTDAEGNGNRPKSEQNQSVFRRRKPGKLPVV